MSRTPLPCAALAPPGPAACVPTSIPPALPYSVIFCEAVAIYGVIVAIILQTKIEKVGPTNGYWAKEALFSGYAIFGSGVTCGFSNLVCG